MCGSGQLIVRIAPLFVCLFVYNCAVYRKNIDRGERFCANDGYFLSGMRVRCVVAMVLQREKDATEHRSLPVSETYNFILRKMHETVSRCGKKIIAKKNTIDMTGREK